LGEVYAVSGFIGFQIGIQTDQAIMLDGCPDLWIRQSLMAPLAIQDWLRPSMLMADLAPTLSANTIVLAVGINDAFKTRKRSDTIAADFERLVRLAKSTGAEVFAATLAPGRMSER
jgi:hypothetical protein